MEKAAFIQLAIEAREEAYVPYSSFKVGAALLLADGSVVKGANIENAAYSLANCAERTALFRAYKPNHLPFKALAVAADTPNPVSPCGACRQVLAELCEPGMPVYLSNINGDWKETTVEALLPGFFKAEDMNESRGNV
ncbi:MULTISPECIES: cytidine deaminase [Shouchella]|uniref:Cytidine deaminase n=3 Tax=Bacillaceae TaxID=186817 RepID=A0A060LS47_9BACI|nr:MULTISPECIES: cytidine deaminase [Bacillaceae]RQW19984.1 cytidine deaminase [Bacillus sp. C1-1]AIC94066.1 cytidine deaminase [Shouchella lehensis G1]KQL58004.1 cytidine deaminase [Alkalicoccobacillus plakortidis]MBG9785699.1 cytidine deaminase [Shouchella lehensis]TES48161.1 cytidine deaminase [Shouchella lehensis]